MIHEVVSDTNSCADLKSFVRRGPTLTTFFFSGMEWREDRKGVSLACR